MLFIYLQIFFLIDENKKEADMTYQYIGLNYAGLLTDGLHKEQLEVPLHSEHVHQDLPPLAGGVGGIYHLGR